MQVPNLEAGFLIVARLRTFFPYRFLGFAISLWRKNAPKFASYSVVLLLIRLPQNRPSSEGLIGRGPAKLLFPGQALTRWWFTPAWSLIVRVVNSLLNARSKVHRVSNRDRSSRPPLLRQSSARVTKILRVVRFVIAFSTALTLLQ